MKDSKGMRNSVIIDIECILENALDAGKIKQTDFDVRMDRLALTKLPTQSLIKIRDSVLNEFTRSMPITGNYLLDSINQQLDKLERSQ